MADRQCPKKDIGIEVAQLEISWLLLQRFASRALNHPHLTSYNFLGPTQLTQLLATCSTDLLGFQY